MATYTKHTEKYRFGEMESREVKYFNTLRDAKKWIKQWDEDTDGEFVIRFQVNNGIKDGMNMFLNPTDAQRAEASRVTGYAL